MLALAWVPISKGAVAVLSFITTVLLGRWLGAQEFGNYSTAVAIALMIGGVVGHTGDAALQRFVPALPAAEIERKQHYARAIFQLKLAGLAAIFALAAATMLTLNDGVASRAAGSTFIVMAGALGMVLVGALASWFQAMQRFGAYVATDLTQNAVRLLLILGLAAFGTLSAASSVVAWTVSSCAVFLCGLAFSGRAAFSMTPSARPVYRDILSMSRWVGLSIVLQMLYSRLDLILVNALAGAQQAGIYAAALNLAGVPELAASFLLAVFYPKIMPWVLAGRYREVLKRFLIYAIPLMALATVLAGALAEPLFRLVYGPEFAPSVQVFRVLIAGTALSFVTLPLAAPYVTLRLPRALVPVEGVALLIIAVGNLLAIPKYGALGAAAVGVVARLALGCMIFTLVFRHMAPVTPPDGGAR